jgi:hypothetical protein
MNLPHTTFSLTDMHSTQPALKIGLLVTVTPEGLPHVSLISSLMACAPQQLAFGQFTEGFSKQHIRANPKAGFLIMGLDKNLWRGKATFTHTTKEGPEYEYYNNVPMFRYNAYFGVHTVYYLDLLAHTGKTPLPMPRIIFAAVKTMLARSLQLKRGIAEVLNPWTQAFLNKLDNLKFIAWVGADGYPNIIPAIQAQCLDRQRILFSTSVYTDELKAIPPGAEVAVLGMALTMEDVLLRGKYLGMRCLAGVKAGVIEVDWVYNPMPPVPGQVYPPVTLVGVEEY